MWIGRDQVQADGVTIEDLAKELSRQLGRPVVDKTGLTGLYEFKLVWSSDEAIAGPGSRDGKGADAPTSAKSTGPSIITAVREQLGLKIEGGKGPVAVLVIDHI
jgi:uncharacterized protein (TIGR03435 family)